MEQIPLDLDTKPTKEELFVLPIEKLNELYKMNVGINPAMRFFDATTLIEGILDPERERARLTLLEAEENREELSKPYRT